MVQPVAWLVAPVDGAVGVAGDGLTTVGGGGVRVGVAVTVARVVAVKLGVAVCLAVAVGLEVTVGLAVAVWWAVAVSVAVATDSPAAETVAVSPTTLRRSAAAPPSD